MKDFRTILKRSEGSNSHFEAIKVSRGNQEMIMSIQASRVNYSEPRQDGLEPLEYSRFEVAFLRDGEFVNPLPNNDKVDLRHDQVMGYVPFENVQSIYEEFVDLSEDDISNAQVVKLSWGDDE